MENNEKKSWLHRAWQKVTSNASLELIGFFLLLSSFGWQVFEEDMTEMSIIADQYLLHEKLDSIWMVVSEDLERSHKIGSYSRNVNLDDLEDTWKNWGDINKHKASLDVYTSFSKISRVILYILGSILLLIPKWKLAQKDET